MSVPDYTFEFVSSYSPEVYNLCTIPDTLGTRNTIIQTKTNEIFSVLNNITSLKVTKMSTFITHDNKVYRLNCSKS